jgi:murein DD-endopeptidase MepM/ murein hydrolase activator NlpD|tara:strand:- start:14031 stop:15362 length:1332 start_codon:yes stop_codon:yes gene_type:complete
VIEKARKVAHFFLMFARDFPRRNMLIAMTLSCLILLGFSFPNEQTVTATLASEPIAISIESKPAQIDDQNTKLQWRTEKVGNGDNLSTLYQRANLSAVDVYQISSSPKGKSLSNLYPGESLRFGTDESNELREVHYAKSLLETHVFTRQGTRYTAEKRLREPEILLAYREGVIQDSLYLSGKRANLPDKLIMEMANIFGWDIDFVFDIRPGDSFSLLYEERFIDGEKLSVGKIIAGSFTNRKKTLNAVRYTDSTGTSDYFTPEGLSMRKTFLRTPLDIFRISSGFNLRRKHPIHKKIMAHRGVDYAAPRGTPVYAAGAGKVIEAGYSKANGNYVFLQHGQTYVTKYLHLNKKKVRKGQAVKQKQLIGTVGSTGYSTGPHLHYEFLVNGVHRNPRTVKLPQAKPIVTSEKIAFQAAITPILVELAQYQQRTQLALKESVPSNAN